MFTDLDNRKFYKGIMTIPSALSETGNESPIEVVSTTDHPDSSYGQKVWVDRDGNGYGNMKFVNPFLTSVKEITEDEVENFLQGDDKQEDEGVTISETH